MTGASDGQREGGTDPGGTVLAVCTGYRCAALHRDGLEDLRCAVRATGGAVMLLVPCMDSCSHGPVVAVGRRAPRTGPGVRLATAATVFGPVGDGPVRRELSDWVRSGAAGTWPVPQTLARRNLSPVMRRTQGPPDRSPELS